MIAVLFPQISRAQIFESKTGVDTLTFAERISLAPMLSIGLC